MKYLAVVSLLLVGAAGAGEQEALAVLRSKAAPHAKAEACRELARVGTREAVPVLAPLLEDAAMSDMARFALEAIPGSEVDEALRQALHKVKGRLLVGVIHSLGGRKDPAAIKPLAALLADPDPTVIGAAAHALGRFGGAALPVLDAALITVADANKSAVVDGLLACAGVDGGAAGAGVFDRMVAQPDLPPHEKVAALRGCVLSRGAEGLPLLAEAIRTETVVPAAAAIAIALDIPGQQVTAMLTAELTAAAEPKLMWLIHALGRRGDATAVSALHHLAQGGPPARRVAALQSLAQLADPSSLPVLAALARDAEPAVAAEALAALAAFPAEGAAHELLDLLPGAAPERKVEVIDALARRRVVAAVAKLCKEAQNPDAKVANASLRALRELGRTEDIPGVLPALSRQATLAAAEAATLAIAAREPDAARRGEVLLPALAAATADAKRALLRVVGQLGNPSLTNAVRAAEKDADPAVRQTAGEVLAAWPAEPGCVPIFNGRNLTGWNGKPGWWSVADGALTSESTVERPCEVCNYLLWRGDTPADFELLLEFKLSPDANSGVQIRSAELLEWDTFGYQADMTGDGSLIGYVYHHQDGLIAGRGERVTISAEGRKSVEPLGDPAELLKHYRKDDWNTYHIVCRGPRITLALNGAMMCEITDHRVTPRTAAGVIGLQMHPGPPMKAQFRNIRLKRD